MNSLPSIARSRRGLLAAGCAAAALALSPAVASADSIVYVKGGNVWLAAGDGGSQYQVTTDGTAEHPYRSPRRPTTARSPSATATRSCACARTGRCSTGSTRRR